MKMYLVFIVLGIFTMVSPQEKKLAQEENVDLTPTSLDILSEKKTIELSVQKIRLNNQESFDNLSKFNNKN